MEDTPQAPAQNDNTLPPTMNPAPAVAPAMGQKHSLLGPILIVGIALIALALGGLYVLNSMLIEEPAVSEDTAGTPATSDTAGPSAETPAAPDDFSDIEAELDQDFSASEEDLGDLGDIDAALEAGA